PQHLFFATGVDQARAVPGEARARVDRIERQDLLEISFADVRRQMAMELRIDRVDHPLARRLPILAPDQAGLREPEQKGEAEDGSSDRTTHDAPAQPGISPDLRRAPPRRVIFLRGRTRCEWPRPPQARTGRTRTGDRCTCILVASPRSLGPTVPRRCATARSAPAGSRGPWRAP